MFSTNMCKMKLSNYNLWDGTTIYNRNKLFAKVNVVFLIHLSTGKAMIILHGFSYFPISK